MSKNIQKAFIIHPFLFAIVPILFLYSYNIEQLPLIKISEIGVPIGIVLGFTLLFLIVAWLLLKKDIIKSGIIISLFLILFSFYGHIYKLTNSWSIGNIAIGRHRYLLFLFAILFSIGTYFTVRTKTDLRRFTNILNVFALVLILFSIFNIALFKYKARDVTENQEINIYKENYDFEAKESFSDIYYLILDGYAAASILNEFYDFDNSEFIDYLTDNGFYIAHKSRSNYSVTWLSIASSLNMEYINYLSDSIGGDSADLSVALKKIENNNVIEILKSKGYKYIHFNSGWSPTDHNNNADMNIGYYRFSEFQVLLIETSMLKVFDRYLVSGDLRESYLYNFSKLNESYKIKGPKFVFYHIPIPHPPYIFDENGELPQDAEFKIDGSFWKHKDNYTNQLIFINKNIKILIDNIILKSEKTPIIILQGDHGTRMSRLKNYTDGEKPPVEAVKENMSILNAIYLPNGGDKLLYDSITPVNTFRVIFNFYYNSNYDLLDDQVYYSAIDTPYNFIDVTNMLPK